MPSSTSALQDSDCSLERAADILFSDSDFIDAIPLIVMQIKARHDAMTSSIRDEVHRISEDCRGRQMTPEETACWISTSLSRVPESLFAEEIT